MSIVWGSYPLDSLLVCCWKLHLTFLLFFSTTYFTTEGREALYILPQIKVEKWQNPGCRGPFFFRNTSLWLEQSWKTRLVTHYEGFWDFKGRSKVSNTHDFLITIHPQEDDNTASNPGLTSDENTWLIVQHTQVTLPHRGDSIKGLFVVVLCTLEKTLLLRAALGCVCVRESL